MQSPFKLAFSAMPEKRLMPDKPLPMSLLAPIQQAQKTRVLDIDYAAAEFQALNRRQFADQVEDFAWTRRIWRIDMHHTWYPTHGSYDGVGCIERMDRFHREERGFDCIAQHVSIAPDGTIWTGRNWNKTPASVGYGMNEGVFMFEVIGNFDHGHDRLEGAQLASVVTVIETVQARFRLPVQALLFHHEVPQTEKTCPGSSVDKTELLRRVKSERQGPKRAVVVAAA
jgi:N-acetylmuramoyl-L-alanine amidase